MADCDNGGVCEEVKCENKSVCYLGYNKEQNVRYRGCMLRDRYNSPATTSSCATSSNEVYSLIITTTSPPRCTILVNDTMDTASGCRETQSTDFNETQCLYCCSNEDNCNLEMVNSDQWPVPAVVVVTDPPVVTQPPVPLNLTPILAGAGGTLFVLIIIIIVVCIFVVRARRRRKNLALLVQQLERFKSRQANKSFVDKGLETLNQTLGFKSGTARTGGNDTLKKGGK